MKKNRNVKRLLSFNINRNCNFLSESLEKMRAFVENLKDYQGKYVRGKLNIRVG